MNKIKWWFSVLIAMTVVLSIFWFIIPRNNDSVIEKPNSEMEKFELSEIERLKLEIIELKEIIEDLRTIIETKEKKLKNLKEKNYE